MAERLKLVMRTTRVLQKEEWEEYKGWCARYGGPPIPWDKLECDGEYTYITDDGTTTYYRLEKMS